MQSAHYRRMDPRELKEIMSQGAIRPETSRDREERRVLEADLAESPVKGKPLRAAAAQLPAGRGRRRCARSAGRAVDAPAARDRGRASTSTSGSSARRGASSPQEIEDPAEFARLWRETARALELRRGERAGSTRHNRTSRRRRGCRWIRGRATSCGSTASRTSASRSTRSGSSSAGRRPSPRGDAAILARAWPGLGISPLSGAQTALRIDVDDRR